MSHAPPRLGSRSKRASAASSTAGSIAMPSCALSALVRGNSSARWSMVAARREITGTGCHGVSGFGCPARPFRHRRAGLRATIAAVKPYQLAIGQTYSFLADVLRGRMRVLEVGCGRGDVARRLGAVGFRVTAIDLRLPDPTPSQNVTFLEHDLLWFDGGPFDAVVFTASLHHIA